MKNVKNYKCTLCFKEYESNKDIYTCPTCGEKGILDVEYDYKKIKETVSIQYFKINYDYSIWRYKEFLPVIDNHYLEETLKVGWTPLYKSNNLSKVLRLKNLYIKDEGLNPTASLKDRASVIAVIKAIENNNKIISCSSTGNAASSLAGNAARLGLKTVIFVPKRAPRGKIAQLLIYGAKVIVVNGDYKQTFELSKQAIDYYGWYNRNAAINPHMVEGKKTVAMEIAEQMNWIVPDWVVVSVGDGCTIAGVYKGFYDLLNVGLIDKIPKLLGVQAKGCSPFYNSFIENKPIKETMENTIADSIAVGIPRNPIKGASAVSKSLGSWVSVSDELILKAMRTLGTYEGIFGEPAGVTSLAGLEKAIKDGIINENDKVCIIVTGNGLKDIESAFKSVDKAITINPDLKELKKYIK